MPKELCMKKVLSFLSACIWISITNLKFKSSMDSNILHCGPILDLNCNFQEGVAIKYIRSYHAFLKIAIKTMPPCVTNHCEFLDYWNTRKSVWRIWQRFSSHDGFSSYLQNSTANSAHLAAHFCPALVCPQKGIVRIQFLPYFWNLLIK